LWRLWLTGSDTATSLITFGFTIYKFFELELDRAKWEKIYVHSPIRSLGCTTAAGAAGLLTVVDSTRNFIERSGSAQRPLLGFPFVSFGAGWRACARFERMGISVDALSLDGRI
jgi:hypothetical protein